MQPDKKHMFAHDMSDVQHIEVLCLLFGSCLKFVDTDLLEDLEMQGQRIEGQRNITAVTVTGGWDWVVEKAEIFIES